MEEGLQEKNLLFLRELAVSHMNNLAVFPLLMAYLALFSREFSVALFLWIPMGFVPFVFYLLRIRFQNFLVILITHIPVCGAVGLFYGQTPCRDFCIITSICYMIYSWIVYARTFDQLDGNISVIVATALSVIVSLVIAVEKDTVLGSFDRMIAAALILYFGLYFFSGYIEKFCNFLVVSKNGAGNIPKEEIFRSGVKMVSINVAVIMGFLFLAADIKIIKNMLQAVRDLIFSLIRFLFSLLPRGSEEAELIYYQEEMNRSQMPFFPAQDNYHGYLWEFLTLTAALFVAIAFFSFLIYALKKVLRFLIRRSNREKLQFAETKQEESEDIRESCRTEQSKTGLSLPDLKPVFWLSPNEKIRRFYKNYIKRNKELLKPADPYFLTARESTRRLSHDRMAEIYEKARYSGEECTNFDYTLFKELSRHKSEK